jgi:hypothetical protein
MISRRVVTETSSLEEARLFARDGLANGEEIRSACARLYSRLKVSFTAPQAWYPRTTSSG